jgi:NADH-quinone oxidoreductase subunit A
LGRRKFAIYECGFRATGGSHKPYVAQYYIIALMFLLFDIELLYLFAIVLKNFILEKVF